MRYKVIKNRKCSEWPQTEHLAAGNALYTLYTERLARKRFSWYKVVKNRKCTKWPQPILEHFTVKKTVLVYIVTLSTCPWSPILVRFALRLAVSKIQGCQNSAMQRMTPNASWAPNTQRYPVYNKYFPLRPKFWSILLYDQRFPRYHTFYNSPLTTMLNNQKRTKRFAKNFKEHQAPGPLVAFLALLVFTQQSYCHGAGNPSSVNSGFSETAAWIQIKFYGKLPIHHISRPLFFFFQNFKFSRIIFVFGNMGTKIAKRYSSHEWIFVSNILTKLLYRFLRFWILTFFFCFHLHGTLWQPKLQNATPSCPRVLHNAGYFSGKIIWIQFGSCGALWKISDVETFKRPLLPQFASNFHHFEIFVNTGPYAWSTPLLSTVVRASARGAGGRGSIPDSVTSKM